MRWRQTKERVHVVAMTSRLQRIGMASQKMHYPRDPSIQIIPTLGPKVCKYHLHWAIWIPRASFEMYISGLHMFDMCIYRNICMCISDLSVYGSKGCTLAEVTEHYGPQLSQSPSRYNEIEKLVGPWEVHAWKKSW